MTSVDWQYPSTKEALIAGVLGVVCWAVGVPPPTFSRYEEGEKGEAPTASTAMMEMTIGIILTRRQAHGT